MRDQRPESQALVHVAAYEYAVGTGIGDKTCRVGRTVRTSCGGQGGHDAHNLTGGGMLQRDHLDVLIAGLVDAANDADNTGDICGSVRNHQHVRAGMGDQVTVLRQQWPQ